MRFSGGVVNTRKLYFPASDKICRIQGEKCPDDCPGYRNNRRIKNIPKTEKVVNGTRPLTTSQFRESVLLFFGRDDHFEVGFDIAGKADGY